MTYFTYEFEDLEIFPGVMAKGEAEFAKVNDAFELQILTFGWKSLGEMQSVIQGEQLWNLAKAAFDKYDLETGRITDAFNEALSQDGLSEPFYVYAQKHLSPAVL